MKIEIVKKEVIDRLNITLYNEQEASTLLTELRSIERNLGFRGVNFGPSYPWLETLKVQLESALQTASTSSIKGLP